MALMTREKFLKFWKGEPIDCVPIWLLAPYHRLDYYTLRLNGAVDSKQNPILCGNLFLHSFPLRYEVFGHIQPFYPVGKGCLVRFLLPDTFLLHWTILAASAFVYRHFLNVAYF